MSADVRIYTTSWCPYCHRAKSLLKKKGVRYDEINVEGRDDLRAWLRDASGQTTVPQTFVNGKAIGGYSDMAELDDEGRLDGLLKEAPPAALPPMPR